jgi:hypothetical protein
MRAAGFGTSSSDKHHDKKARRTLTSVAREAGCASVRRTARWASRAALVTFEGSSDFSGV